jgi:hypothetical protein
MGATESRVISAVLEAIAKVERTLERHEAERRVERLDSVSDIALL